MSQKLSKFSDYDQFWHFYLEQHSKPLTKTLHAIGLIAALIFAIVMIALGHPWAIPLGLVISYGLAWIGHFGVEKNVPATFTYPLWSLISDFRMTFLWVTGKLQPPTTSHKEAH